MRVYRPQCRDRLALTDGNHIQEEGVELVKRIVA